MDKFFDDNDLADVFAQFNAEIENNKAGAEDETEFDKEMEASQRRYEEIIKKNN